MRTIVIIVFAVLVGISGYVFFGPKEGNPTSLQEGIVKEEDQLELVDFSKLNSAFRFSGQIPLEFEVEYLPQLKALSVYDPRLPGENIREK